MNVPRDAVHSILALCVDIGRMNLNQLEKLSKNNEDNFFVFLNGIN